MNLKAWAMLGPPLGVETCLGLGVDYIYTLI
jgi:hypothetical protein